VGITDAGGVGGCDYPRRRKVVKKILSQKQRVNEATFRRVWVWGVRPAPTQPERTCLLLLALCDTLAGRPSSCPKLLNDRDDPFAELRGEAVRNRCRVSRWLARR
jgi:hypothetical protein